MQIIPTSVSSNETLWNAATNNSFDDELSSSFIDALNDSLKETGGASTESANMDSQSTGTASTARAATQVQSPYSRNTSDGVTYTLDEVCFTKQEVQSLHDDLVKAGATPESLTKLAALADMPDGATLAQVMASVKGGSGTPVLSDEDKTNISSLLKKIDPSGVLDTNVQALMLQGQGQQALNTIFNFVGQLDPAGTLDITQAEAVSLGRGLGLGASNLQTLANNFGGATSLTCLNEQFSTLMAPATDFFTSRAASQKTLDNALKTTLQPRISKARARTEKEKQANALVNRKAQQSKVYIDKTVQQKSHSILNQTLDAGQDTGTGTALPGANSEAVGKAGAQLKQAEEAAAQGKNATAPLSGFAEKMANSATNAKSAAQTTGLDGQAHAQSATQQATALDDKGQKSSSRNAGQNGTDQDAKNKPSWSDLLGKVDAQSAAMSGRATVAAAPQTAQETAADRQNMATPLAQQAAQQVEKGMLSTIKGGGARLDLQLNPQELGSITVSLTVRNGEVSAKIRSEKTETTEMLHRQAESIRANLEQQGIKVDKVEVQQDTKQDQNALSWQDLSQHNQQQEEDARREELARLRNLATVRNISSNSASATLEQPVHSLGHTAIYATGNLNVVA